MSEEKTEQATPHKLREARKEGQVSRSADLTAAISMMAVVLLLATLGSQFSDAMRAIVDLMLGYVSSDHSLVRLQVQIYKLGAILLLALLPFAGTAALASFLTSAAQTGIQISMKPVTPNIEMVSPAAGLKRVFSVKTLIEAAKMVVKAAIIFFAMWETIKLLLPLVVGSLYQPLPGLTHTAWVILLKLFMVASVLFVVIGAADAKLQNLMFHKKMRMSKDEVKRERKTQEGDPRIKGERRKLAREMISGPPPAEKVSLANMMVVNPMHYAVAVRYAPQEHPLPLVVAKGVDEQAAALRRAARDAGVPIIGNPPVARALHKVGENEPIPEELFETVAAILRWINAIGATRKQDDLPAPERVASPPTLH
jgi:type III secretion protein U